MPDLTSLDQINWKKANGNIGELFGILSRKYDIEGGRYVMDHTKFLTEVEKNTT